EEDIVIIDLMTFGFDIKLKELTFERFQEFYKSRTFIKGEENYYIEFDNELDIFNEILCKNEIVGLEDYYDKATAKGAINVLNRA
ncbi:MAG: hypothetical protein ACRC6E_08335, partial [Fusobacteriaceae bacterium]